MSAHSVNVAAVCTEEFVCNIIRHGHAGSIDLAAAVNDGAVNISIHDDGAAFNPVEAVKAASGNALQTAPDAAGPMHSDERIGLGLTLATTFCHDLDYKYIFNQNMLTLKIRD